MNGYQISQYRRLKSGGVEVSKTNSVEFNGGSETTRHFVGKALAAKVLKEQGYRVNSEVAVNRGEVDVLGWAHPDRISYAVEIETDPAPDIVESKVKRYITETPINDIVVIDATEIPENMIDARAYVQVQLGL